MIAISIYTNCYQWLAHIAAIMSSYGARFRIGCMCVRERMCVCVPACFSVSVSVPVSVSLSIVFAQ